LAGKIYMIKDDDELVAMNEKKYDREIDFQDLLESYPDLIPGDQIDSENPRRWLLVKREMGLPFEEEGARQLSLDHFFLDQEGIPTLVEVKRSSDTRLRREVIGQMLDYAANAVAYISMEEIREKVQTKYDDLKLQDDFLDDATNEENFWENVKTNIEEGRIRMLFVADEIPHELKTIIEFLNIQMNKSEVLGVEIKQYQAKDEKIRTLVSRVFGQTIEAKRIKGGKGSGSIINKEIFFENLDQHGKNFFKTFFRFIDEKGLIINWGIKGFSVNVEIGNTKISILQGYCLLRSNGQIINSTIGSISKKVDNGDEIAKDFVSKSTKIRDFVKQSSGGFVFNLSRDLNDEELLKFQKIISQTIEDIKKNGLITKLNHLKK